MVFHTRRTAVGNNPRVHQAPSLTDKFKQKVSNLGETISRPFQKPKPDTSEADRQQHEDDMRNVGTVANRKPAPPRNLAEEKRKFEEQQETANRNQSHSPRQRNTNAPGTKENPWKMPPVPGDPAETKTQDRNEAERVNENIKNPKTGYRNYTPEQQAKWKKERDERRAERRGEPVPPAEPKPEEPTLKDKVKEKAKEFGKEAYKAVKDNLKDRKEKATATTAEQAEAIRTATMKTGLNGNVLYRKTDGSWFNSGRKARVAVGVDPDYIDPVTGLPMEIEPEKDEDDDDIEGMLKKMGSGSRSRSVWSPKSTRSSKYDDDEATSPSVRGRTKQWSDEEEKARLASIEGASSPFAGSSYLSVGKARSQPETEEEEQARLASFTKNPLGIKKSQYSANTYRGWNQADEDRVRQSDTGAGSGMSALSSGLYKFGYGNKKPQPASQPVPMQQQVQMPAEPRVRLNKADYAAFLQQKRMAEQEMPQSVPQQVAPEVQQPPQKRLTAVEEMFGLKMGMGITHPSAPQQQARAPPQRASSAMQELFGVSFGNSPKPQSQKKPAKPKPVTQSKYFALGGEYKHTDHTNLQKLERTMGASLYSPKKLISGKLQRNLLMDTLGYRFGETPKKPTINKAIVKKCGSTGSRGLKKEVLGSGVVNHHMLEDLLGYSYGSKQKPKKQPVKVATKISVPKKFLKPETSVSVTQELFGKRTRL
jgi:hypothetical protein